VVRRGDEEELIVNVRMSYEVLEGLYQEACGHIQLLHQRHEEDLAWKQRAEQAERELSWLRDGIESNHERVAAARARFERQLRVRWLGAGWKRLAKQERRIRAGYARTIDLMNTALTAAEESAEENAEDLDAAWTARDVFQTFLGRALQRAALWKRLAKHYRFKRDTAIRSALQWEKEAKRWQKAFDDVVDDSEQNSMWWGVPLDQLDYHKARGGFLQGRAAAWKKLVKRLRIERAMLLEEMEGVRQINHELRREKRLGKCAPE
jgi:hypothetical protein